MKQLLTFSVLAGIIAMASCKEEGSNMGHLEALKDSVFKTYPTVASINMDVKASTELIIVLGDRVLFSSSAAKQQQEANELGTMALHIFGKDNSLETGEMIVTSDEKNESLTPANAKTININIDSLRKALKQ